MLIYLLPGFLVRPIYPLSSLNIVNNGKAVEFQHNIWNHKITQYYLKTIIMYANIEAISAIHNGY